MKEAVSRPRTVSLACALSFVLCMWDIGWALSGEGLEDMPYFRVFLVALNLIPLAFTVAAYIGRYWGRIGLLVVTALGVLPLPLVIFFEKGWGQELDVETLLYSAAAILVVALLLLPASGAWYRRLRAPAEA